MARDGQTLPFSYETVVDSARARGGKFRFGNIRREWGRGYEGYAGPGLQVICREKRDKHHGAKLTQFICAAMARFFKATTAVECRYYLLQHVRRCRYGH